MEQIENTEFDNIRERCKSIEEKIVWVSLWAYQRIIPSYLIPSYEIVCNNDSQDNKNLNSLVKITSLEANNEIIAKKNSTAIISSETLRELAWREKTYVITNKTSKAQEAAAKKVWVTLLHNTSTVRREFENKKKFKEHLKKMENKIYPLRVLQYDRIR